MLGETSTPLRRAWLEKGARDSFLSHPFLELQDRHVTGSWQGPEIKVSP